MTATNEAWISDSLARLEQLEGQRERLAATGQTEALAELEEEIKSLYEVLEAAADDSGGAANTGHAAATTPSWSPSVAAAPAAAVPHPAFGPTPQAVVMAAPAMAPVATSPFDAAPAFAPAPPMMSAPASTSYDDDADLRGGSKLPLVLGLVVVLGGLGGGGWWYMNRGTPQAAVAAPTAPTTVIQAGAIPEDTQEPDVAKGGDASRTPLVPIKEPTASDDPRRPSRPASSGSAGPSRPARPDKGDGRPGIKVDSTDDPLAGVK